MLTCVFLKQRYYSTYLVSVYRTCRTNTKRNATACQALGNLCVLNMYNTLKSVDACTAFNSVQKTSSSVSNGVDWGDLMPWLFYSSTYEALKSSYTSIGTSDSQAQYITLKFSGSNRCNASLFSFYAAIYALNGSLLSYGPINLGDLQLCNQLSQYENVATVSPFSTSSFYQSCNLSASSLLDYAQEPLFYDLYLKV